MKKNIIFITGVSGSGKTFIKDSLIKNYPKNYYTILQYTTREKRENEKNGIDYNFITENEYNKISNKLFCKTNVNNNLYGTPLLFQDNKTLLIVVNTLGLLDGLEYIKNNNEFQYRVLDIKNSSPVKRTDRDKKFVDTERKELDSILKTLDNNKVIHLSNDSDHYLKCNDVNEIIKILF